MIILTVIIKTITMVMMIAIIIKTTIIIIINKVYEFLGCEQAKKVDVKYVMERVNKEMNKRMEQWIGMSLHNEIWWKQQIAE